MTTSGSVLERLSAELDSRYHIDGELGRGGMATVYLAEDVRHHRKVAIKVLHPELSAILGGERFLKEIELTANLQHPHILPLFDSGSADGLLYYVMPYVEGETLRGRIERERQLPIADAVRIASDVAEALEYAHKRGVIHRDIKPENILLHGGRPLVADFGIALAVQQAGGERMTQTGMSLGTPQYMAPEQAMGDRNVDHRADIYALGAVTYEMIAGEPPFTGPTSQAIVAKVITTDPARVATYRKSVPAHVDDAIDTALEKIPADRFASADEFARALQGEPVAARRSGRTESARAGRGMGASTSALQRYRLLILLLLAAAGGVAIGALAIRRPELEDKLPVRFTVELPDDRALAAGTLTGSRVAVSPADQQIVYVGDGPTGQKLFVRPLDALDGSPLEGTDGAYNPSFSPDGRWIAFVAANEIRKIPLGGGPPTRVASISGLNHGVAWLSIDTIAFTQETGQIGVVSSSGGQVRPISRPDSLLRMWWPQPLPGGDRWLVTIWDPQHLYRVGIFTPATKSVELLLENASYARYVTTGYLIFRRSDGTLTAARFDLRSRRITGPQFRPFTADVAETGPRGGVAEIDVSPRGTAVYVTGGSTQGQLVLVDTAGKEEVMLADVRPYESLRFSPDGSMVATTIASANNAADIWLLNRGTGALTRLTSGTDNFYPVWTPDGRAITFTSRRSGVGDIYVQPIDGSTAPRLILHNNAISFPSVWTPDGKTLLYRRTDPGGYDIMAIGSDQKGSPRPIVAGPSNEVAPALSPDGRWLAYVSDESGRSEVYVRSYPGGGPRAQVSTNGGTEPAWTRDGRALLYRSGNAFFRAGIRTTPALSAERSKKLFAGSYRSNSRWREFDIDPRDGRIAIARTAGGPPKVVVALNWFTELEARAKDAR